MSYILLCALLILPHNFAFPLTSSSEGSSTKDRTFAEEYLNKFYPSFQRSAGGNLERNIKEMQHFFHLNVTGKLDNETVNIMKQRRCGVPDTGAYRSFAKGSRWGKKMLTYRIVNYTPDLPRTKVDKIIQQAFKVWSDVTPLQFKRTSGPADIHIGFAYRAHGDSEPFDGRGNVLAHAFSPLSYLSGDVHFDESEQWSLTNRGVNLFLVAAHEFGHSLGLDHSSVFGALMYPNYRYTMPHNFILPLDDRQRIQKLYGKRK